MIKEQEKSERERFVKTALTWVNVRYEDHGDTRAGADCAGFLKGALVESQLLLDFPLPFYHPQQWLHRDFEDRTYLNIVLSIAYEITEPEVLSGDLVMYLLVKSWTHGGVVVSWPSFVLHSVKGRGVVGVHGSQEGFLIRRPRRFFRLNRWKDNP